MLRRLQKKKKKKGWSKQKSGSEITLEDLDNPKIINKFENITLEFPNYIPSNLQSKLMDIYVIKYKNKIYNKKYYIVTTLNNLKQTLKSTKQTLKSTKQLTRFPIKLYPVKNIKYFFKHAESFHTTNTCGIENTGNSCYQNTFYQFLFSTQIIANFFLESLELKITLDEEEKKSELYYKKITILHLANLIRIYWKLEKCGNNNKILEYAVKSIKEKFFNKIGGEVGIRFANANQQDSHEFFTYLFNTVINEGLGYIQYKDKKKKAEYPTVGPNMNTIIKNNNEILKLSNISEFHKIISFLIIQTIECSNKMCKNQSFAIQGELENHIVLNICLLENDTTKDPYSYIAGNGDMQYYHPRKVTEDFKSIEECIENYKIESNVEKKCEKCSTHKNIQHTKKLKLYGADWGPPPIFIIHLKRLIYIERHDILVKKKESIMIGDDNSFILKKPFEVEESDINYELFAFINHKGEAMGGHYIYHTRDNRDNKWTKYSDSLPIKYPNKSEVIKKASIAVVLFFRKCSS